MSGILKNNAERYNFINSNFGKYLINKQIKALNSVTNGDISQLGNLYENIVDYLNELYFKDEKMFPELKFEELLQSSGNYAVSYSTPNGNSGIVLDKRFLYLNEYKNIDELKNADFETVYDDQSILAYGIICLLHEFTHQLQGKLFDEINSNNKKTAFKTFSKEALIGSAHVNTDFSNFSDEDAESIFNYYLKITKKTKEEVLNKLTPYYYQIIDNENYLLAELLLHIRHCQYYYAPEEIHARDTSHLATANLLKTWQKSNLISLDSLNFIYKILDIVENNYQASRIFEFDFDYQEYVEFTKLINQIDNHQLFDFINKEGIYLNNLKKCSKNDKLIKSKAKQLTFFLKNKGSNGVKEFFEYTINNPNDFSIMIIKESLKNDTYDILNNHLNKKYFTRIKKSLKENEKPIESTQIFPDMLTEKQQNKLFKYFILNHMWDHAVRLLNSKSFEFNQDREVICELKNSIDEILKYYSGKEKNNDNEIKKRLLFSLNKIKISTLHEI